MAGYVFKNGAQLLPFRFWVSGYRYLIYGTYLNMFGSLYIHISNSKIERESKIKRQNKKQNI